MTGVRHQTKVDKFDVDQAADPGGGAALRHLVRLMARQSAKRFVAISNGERVEPERKQEEP